MRRILPSTLLGKPSERAVKGTESISVSNYNRDVLDTPQGISLPNSNQMCQGHFVFHNFLCIMFLNACPW